MRSVGVIGAASLLSMVGWGGVVDWGRLVGSGLVLRVLGNAFVADISDISTIGVGNAVGDNLGAAVRKGNAVRSGGSVPVPLLVLGEVGTGVVVSDSVLIGVDSRGNRLLVGWCGVVGRGRVVHRGWGVSWGWVAWGSRGNGSAGKNSKEGLRGRGGKDRADNQV